ncbi:TetR/AcrR family transcriptional regulator [Paenibacillus agilis]|uniref:TetR/AcrR family transcriptional regulator n=1 Tax=Paenibacillus agilis TaxID=3020863 RepID=A0A559IW63_9BACL|nr:TetR/AcrR family transcriptional regulator [Paenibacillus agilis]TVX91870.1 TetR/AcrR family transcriptional regulator [Paenibacillus agilis]
MTEKLDRRQLRTKQLLRQALLSIVETKGFDGITVSELAQAAGINRGTFYLHYSDVPHMVESIHSEMMNGLQAIMEEVDINELFTVPVTKEPYRVVVRVLEYMELHTDYFKVTLGPKGDTSILLQLKKMLQKQMYSKLTFLFPDAEMSPFPLDYLIAYASSANIGIIQHWFETGCKLRPKEVASLMLRILQQGPRGSIGLS